MPFDGCINLPYISCRPFPYDSPITKQKKKNPKQNKTKNKKKNQVGLDMQNVMITDGRSWAKLSFHESIVLAALLSV